MSGTWRTYSVLKDEASQSVLASQTGQQVSKDFALRDRTRVRIDITTSASTTAAAQSFKLQAAGAKDGSGNWIWEDVKSVSVTTDAGYKNWVIRVNPEDGTDLTKLPLGKTGRVVAVTGVGDTSTVVALQVTDVI